MKITPGKLRELAHVLEALERIDLPTVLSDTELQPRAPRGAPATAAFTGHRTVAKGKNVEPAKGQGASAKGGREAMTRVRRREQLKKNARDRRAAKNAQAAAEAGLTLEEFKIERRRQAIARMHAARWAGKKTKATSTSKAKPSSTEPAVEPPLSIIQTAKRFTPQVIATQAKVSQSYVRDFCAGRSIPVSVNVAVQSAISVLEQATAQ